MNEPPRIMLEAADMVGESIVYGDRRNALLWRVRAPILTTLHTVLERFKAEQAAAVEELATH